MSGWMMEVWWFVIGLWGRGEGLREGEGIVCSSMQLDVWNEDGCQIDNKGAQVMDNV